MQFSELMSLSPVMPVLFGCSVLMAAYALERSWYYIINGRTGGGFTAGVLSLIREGRHKEALALCSKKPGLLPGILAGGISSLHLPREDASQEMETRRLRAEALLHKNFTVFGTLSFIAPLLGLLGTVLGIIRAFNDIALTGSGGPAVIAAGVSEALFTTAAGIIIAIPAAVIHNVLQNRAQHVLTSAEAAGQDILAAHYSRTDGQKEATGRLA